MLWLATILSLVPVVAFLAALLLLDSYKLLSLQRILVALAAGIAAALVALFANDLLFAWLGVALATWIAPLIEELLKAIFPLWSIRAHRAGFPVDAGILGFATGAGFSLVENVAYLHLIPDGTPVLWLVRGLGTAVMHGTTTAIVAILVVSAQGRRRRVILASAGGLLIAIAVHLFHNSSLLSPV